MRARIPEQIKSRNVIIPFSTCNAERFFIDEGGDFLYMGIDNGICYRKDDLPRSEIAPTMSTGRFLEKYKFFTALIVLIAIGSTGCARVRDLTEDKSYLTPIPQATLDAFQFGQLVKTKLQAVIAAQKGILTFHTNRVRQLIAIFAETMEYEEARRRVEGPGSASYDDPTPLDTQVGLVVFEGEWTIIEPLGTITAPFSGCAYAVFSAKDGSGMRAGTNSCKSLNLDQ